MCPGFLLLFGLQLAPVSLVSVVPAGPSNRSSESVTVCAGGTHATTGAAACAAAPATALQLARTLSAPVASMIKNGEFEGGDFWADHEELLRAAWKEVPRLHPVLYSFDEAFEESYITEVFRDAVAQARADGDEAAVMALFHEVAAGSPGVMASDKLFTGAFLRDMREELEYLSSVGIPMRRPNGMNRYGSILDELGFEAMLTGLVDKYIRPLAELFFPDVVGVGDVEEHYAFSVRYAEGEDVDLQKHRDASVVTLNLCLGVEWEGGALRFFGDGPRLGYHLASWVSPREREQAATDEKSFEDEVTFTPGMVVFHRGQHQHQALELVSGVRTNLILWLFGEHGVVRVAPYPPEQRGVTTASRWARGRPRLGSASLG